MGLGLRPGWSLELGHATWVHSEMCLPSFSGPLCKSGIHDAFSFFVSFTDSQSDLFTVVAPNRQWPWGTEERMLTAAKTQVVFL